MSEKKSWDIQPNRRPVKPAPQAPAPYSRPVRTSAPTPVLHGSVRRDPPRVPKGKDREPLKDRRKREKKRRIFTYSLLVVVFVCAVLGSFWLPETRIQHVNAAGIDAAQVQSIVSADTLGTYHFIIPRNSIFFFPENQIRADILNQYPEISAVAISRESLNTIGIVSIPREAALTWCGATYVPELQIPKQIASSSTLANAANANVQNNTSCYSADAEGVIFAPLSAEDVDSSNTLRIYGPLASSSNNRSSSFDQTPLGQTIAQANLIPNALQLIKVIKGLGVPIVSFVIRGDEADLYAQSGTRITYVLGHEEVTAQVAEAAFPSLNLNDGSLEYVDLRFEGKAYYKKVGSTAASAASNTPSGN